MFIEVWQVILGALGTVIVSAGSALTAIWFRSKSAKRKEGAEAGISEVDLRMKEQEFVDMRMNNLKDAIIKQDETIRDLRDKLVLAEREQTRLKIAWLEAVEEKDIAKHWECKVEVCNNRIPPRIFK